MTPRPLLDREIADVVVYPEGAEPTGSTVNFEIDDEGEDIGEARLQLKFGPSAWFANESDPAWRHTVDPAAADYSRLFLTRAAKKEVRQSVVTLQEVVDGLDSTDTRLHDEIIQLLSHRT